MAAFRILDQAPTYLLDSGQVNAGGFLWSYENDLITLKSTWSDEAMTVLNPNPILLDGTGRTATDVWGDGEYGFKLTDALGVTLWTRNNVQAAGGTGTTIPALVTGQFLTNDGSKLQWVPILEVPDPTGSSGEFLTTDGSNVFWGAIPAPTPSTAVIDVGTTSLIAGEGSGERFCFQTGTATIPSNAGRTSSVNISFSPSFTKILAVFPITSTYAVNAFGAGATLTAEGYTVGSASTGATLRANSADDGGGSGDEILNPMTCAWMAVGLIAAA